MSIVQLEFLTKDQAHIELCRKYWDMNNELRFVYKTTDIAREYNIKPRDLIGIVTSSCKATLLGDVCSDCGTQYIYSSRDNLLRRNRGLPPAWLCETCTQRREDQRAAERAAKDAERRALIQSIYGGATHGPRDPATLSLEDAVFLTSLVRLCGTEDLSHVRSLGTVSPGSFSPKKKFDHNILNQLWGHNLIFVHPDSPVEAFGEENPRSVYLFLVNWLTPIRRDGESPLSFISELEDRFRTKQWPDEWNTQWHPLWKKIAIEECLQYLEMSLAEHKLALSPGEKTLLVLNNTLEDYAVSQVFNFIWRAVRDAAAFYMRESVPKQHAANTVVGAIQRYAERAKSEAWEVKPFRRNYNLPQSMVSRVFSDAVMQFGDEGFERAPRIGAVKSELDEDTEYSDV